MAHQFRFTRRYVGPLKACILDWSGTTVDRYVLAPALVFMDVFRRRGVQVTMQEAREPMGLRKDLHIRAMINMPSVREKWSAKFGRDPNLKDVDAMFHDFIPLQLESLPRFAELIPGCAESIRILREDFGMKIGSTTGFTKAMVEVLLREAKKQGYVPDASVAGDDVIHGARPRPFMLMRNLDLLDVHPIQAVVKVDDTISGIGEALNAGCWGVGVSRYSNYMDVDSLEQGATLDPEDLAARLTRTRDLLWKSGAHYVVDSIAELPSVCEDINRRLSNGERP